MAEEAGSHPIGGWISLGGAIERGVAVTSWGDGGECELFAIHDDGELRDRYWDGRSWHDWKSLGGTFTGQPAAAARDADRIDVFAFDRDGRLHHRWWDGATWVPWRIVGGAPRGDSVSCSWSGGRLDVFVSHGGGAVWYRALEGVVEASTGALAHRGPSQQGH